MRVNVDWLRDWVRDLADPATLAEELTNAGLEVDSISPAAERFDGVVVAEVLEVAAHPNGDRLRLCVVDDGGSTHQVVCGADNVTTGIRVPFARPGAQLPRGRNIAGAKVRGIDSAGMLCSADELGLEGGSDGLMLLDDDAPVGQDLREYLALDDAVLDIDLTPNRGDCFSVLGIAREIAARRGLSVTGPSSAAWPARLSDRFPVELKDTGDCPRFVGRVIRGVSRQARTPLWMRERLRRAGVRSINPVVDVTNYVMLELGQPLHAYDIDKLDRAIIVRRARNGERLNLLDGRQIELESDTLVIADRSGPVGLAGVMGGAGTAVDEQTVNVFLEAAHFVPRVMAGRARRYGLHTDASVRFERGVDPQLPARALERASTLLGQIVGGSAGPAVVDGVAEFPPISEPIVLRHSRLESVLGLALDADRVVAVLRSLQMQLSARDDGWDVVPPSHRFDIGIEEDLIEEVGRMIGYDEIPIVPGTGASHLGSAPETSVDGDRAADFLVARGYTEVVTFSFVDAALEQLISPGDDAVRLANPIASDLAVMRRSLWPGLLQVATQNLSRQQSRLRLFEMGREFRASQRSQVVETTMLAGLAVGSREPEHWSATVEEVDFYDIKSDVEALIALTGRGEELVFSAADHPALKPGYTARITVSGREAGWVGLLHPLLERRLEIRANVVLFALNMDDALRAVVPAFRKYSRFPSVRRDLAVVVEESVAAEQLRILAHEACGELLRRAIIFDVYRGKGVDSGRKSIALGLILQDVSRTLTDADADEAVRCVTRRLKRELGATIRTQAG